MIDLQIQRQSNSFQICRVVENGKRLFGLDRYSKPGAQILLDHLEDVARVAISGFGLSV
jgi:hypothetical protein